MIMPATRTDPTVDVGGWINGFIGVVIYSGSLPATRMAVQQFDPLGSALVIGLAGAQRLAAC